MTPQRWWQPIALGPTVGATCRVCGRELHASYEELRGCLAGRPVTHRKMPESAPVNGRESAGGVTGAAGRRGDPQLALDLAV